jgi:plasmid stabilization system protein ParE
VAGASGTTILMRIRWTPAALNDLQKISSYIEAQSDIATANRICRIIYTAVQSPAFS